MGAFVSVVSYEEILEKAACRESKILQADHLEKREIYLMLL